MDIEGLLYPHSGQVHLLDTERLEIEKFRIDCETQGILVCQVRGSRMRDFSALTDEISAAFQFPWYFGGSANALDECLSDLSWLGNPGAIVMSVLEPLQILSEDQRPSSDEPASMHLFCDIVRTAQDELRRGESDDVLPFNVVLHAGTGGNQVRKLWAESGFSVV